MIHSFNKCSWLVFVVGPGCSTREVCLGSFHRAWCIRHRRFPRPLFCFPSAARTAPGGTSAPLRRCAAQNVKQGSHTSSALGSPQQPPSDVLGRLPPARPHRLLSGTDLARWEDEEAKVPRLRGGLQRPVLR